LKSPKNAQRLFDALERSKARDNQLIEALSTEKVIAQLKQEFDFEQEEGKT
jgi:hypothetical protein